MFCTIKSKKIIIDNKQHSPVAFCTLLNDQRALILFQNSSFIIINTHPQSKPPIVYEDSLNKTQKIIDCKRIKTNVCSVISQSHSTISFIRYLSDHQVFTGDITISQMRFFKDLSVSKQLIYYNNQQFVIKCQCYLYRTTYFTVLTESKQQEFNYEICIKSYQHQPVHNNTEVFKAIPLTSQLAFFQQKSVENKNWKIDLIKINQQKSIGQLQVSSFLHQHDILLDIIAKTKKEYYIFVVSQQENKSIIVFKCTIFQNLQKLSQICNRVHSFKFENPLFLQIININYLKNIFLLKTFSHTEDNGQIYNNYLQIRHLDTGELIEKIPCNLKSYDFSPNNSCFIDYSQQFDSSEQIILHFRNYIFKQHLCLFLLNSTKTFSHPTIKQLYSDIVSFL